MTSSPYVLTRKQARAIREAARRALCVVISPPMKYAVDDVDGIVDEAIKTAIHAGVEAGLDLLDFPRNTRTGDLSAYAEAIRAWGCLSVEGPLWAAVIMEHDDPEMIPAEHGPAVEARLFVSRCAAVNCARDVATYEGLPAAMSGLTYGVVAIGTDGTPATKLDVMFWRPDASSIESDCQQPATAIPACQRAAWAQLYKAFTAQHAAAYHLVEVLNGHAEHAPAEGVEVDELCPVCASIQPERSVEVLEDVRALLAAQAKVMRQTFADSVREWCECMGHDPLTTWQTFVELLEIASRAERLELVRVGDVLVVDGDVGVATAFRAVEEFGALEVA